jgi:hypothetical protein
MTFFKSSLQPRGNAKVFLIILILALVVGFISSGVLLFSMLKGNVSGKPAQMNTKVSEFLTYTSAYDFDSAYALATVDFKTASSRDDFEKMIKLLPAQYTEFNSVTQTGYKFNKNLGSPTMHTFFGDILYTDGTMGQVEAVLIEEEGVLKINYINVRVGMDRMEKFPISTQSPILGVSTSR